MVNATHTVNPVLALIDSYSGLAALQAANSIESEEKTAVAIQAFKKYAQNVSNDLLTYLPSEMQIVPSVAAKLGEWHIKKT
jgi:hypothetical protein